MVQADALLSVSTQLSEDPRACRLVLVGEIDLLTAPLIADAIGEVMAQGVHHVEIDMAGVTFADASGLRILAEAGQELTGRGGSLRIRKASALFVELLHIAGLTDRIAVEAPRGRSPLGDRLRRGRPPTGEPDMA